MVVVTFSVKVKVAVPAVTPVITPALVMVATEGLLLTHVPAEFGSQLMVCPIQTSVGPDNIGQWIYKQICDTVY
ncbi:hypothetical protein MASR2M47_15690 [Draconibacterium sp.]